MRAELARATTMLDLGRYTEAGRVLARIVAAEPESSRAWCLLARAHLGAGHYADAVTAARRAVTLSPEDEWPHRLASNALMHLGRHAESLQAANESCRLAPSYWQTHVCVAQSALAAGYLSVAATSATEARRLAPGEPDVHFLSGKVCLARGELAPARDYQERALALDPGHSGAMNELGRIRLRKHDTTGAIKHFISAARTTPSERIYSRNIEVVILRAVSRTIYLFTLVALALIWIPACIHVPRFPFAAGLALLGLLVVGSFAVLLTRMPREARSLLHRTLRNRRVVQSLALAVSGVGAAFAILAFVPADAVPQMLPVAVILTFAARVAAFAALRTTLGTR
jgi:tetratricopeptide (TPR) repeat protein